jgi:hypothetical protein
MIMKRIMQIIEWGVALLVIALSSLSLQAQTAPADTMGTVGMDFKNNTYFAVGANIGLLSGAGLAARASFPGGLAAQLAFLPISVPGATYTTHFNIGAEVQYGFNRTASGRLYSLLGMGYYGTWSDDSTKPGNVIANPFRIGIGLGYEYFTSPNFVIALSGAITYFPNTSEFFPLPEIGFFYYFK